MPCYIMAGVRIPEPNVSTSARISPVFPANGFRPGPRSPKPLTPGPPTPPLWNQNPYQSPLPAQHGSTVAVIRLKRY